MNQPQNGLVQALDRGIDDMETQRELPMGEAFQKITELRNNRRNEKNKVF